MKQTLLVVAVLLFAACGSKKADNSWLHENEVRVAIDASFANVMQNEIDAFSAKHVEAEVMPIYTSEDSVVWMLMKDSVRCGIATRELTPDEIKYIRSVHKLTARQMLLAYDAFALITHKSNKDTVITTSEIRDIALGKITRWDELKFGTRRDSIKLVFDQSGSSTVRFIRDSICGGKPLTGNVYAEGSSLGVIEAVKNNPSIIGVVSTDWLRQSNQGALNDFHSLDVNVMLVSRGHNALDMSNICRPYQYYIATGDYPLVRRVYVIHTDPRPNSMLKNFFFFLRGDGGQRIICNDSQLLPYLRVQVRDVKMQ